MIKTVVIVYDQAFVSGGAAKIAIGSAIALKKRGYRVIYFAAMGPIDNSLVDAEVEVVCIDGKHIAETKNPKDLLKGIWNSTAMNKLTEILSNLDARSTVVHIHGWTKSLSSSIFVACKKANMKTFITLHEYFTICQNGGLYNYKKDRICSLKPGSIKCYFCNCDKKNYLQKIYRNFRQIFQKYALNLLKPNVIYITEFSKSILEQWISFAKNSYMVTNNVETTYGERVLAEKNSNYLFIGRMSQEKGPELFCEAVSHANVEAIVVGDGQLYEKVKNAYNKIEFTGWLSSEEMNKYLDKARCLIISSKWYETMGLTIIEMQGKGIPCIVPDKCAGIEYIKDGITGLKYKIGDVKSLTEVIEITKDDSTVRELSENFYNDFNEHKFSMDRHVTGLEKIYNL